MRRRGVGSRRRGHVRRLDRGPDHRWRPRRRQRHGPAGDGHGRLGRGHRLPHAEPRRRAPAPGATASSDPASGLVDATAELGLVDALVGIYGHAAAAADVNADGWTDLFVAGFADRPEDEYRHRGAEGPSPDRLLLGGPDGFRPDDAFPGELARTSGATFADLDGDGDIDLVVARNPRPDGEIADRPTTVYDNRAGSWVAAATLAHDVGARSIAALDVDRDGLGDLAVLGDRFGGGPTTFLRNLGGFEFQDATAAWGIPDDLYGLALATVDLDGDGWVDVVTSGDERVLLGGPDGFTVVELPVLRWEVHGDEDDSAGIAVGDLDGDGRPDLAVGQHFNSTVDDGQRVPVRLFLNRSEAGAAALEDVTEAAGSPGLPDQVAARRDRRPGRRRPVRRGDVGRGRRRHRRWCCTTRAWTTACPGSR